VLEFAFVAVIPDAFPWRAIGWALDRTLEIRFRIERPRPDGRGLVDNFDIEVRKKNLDRARLVDELSGGQFVLVNEAVNLGIAFYNMQ